MRSRAGRVLGLAVVAVLVMSAVGLAATQTFINKTGRTVIGIKVEFSKSVRITRHDSALPDQSPNGRSDQFTFNGGELHNYGRFSIAWLPSSGKVTHYEWIERAQPAQQPQHAPVKKEEEFVLPDPNTPPILYGNDYPGPNEPLYQPKPDEQIWLTDLDGHGDIYDNDSIVINYTPGFDKSQITKIDVYRNGIKLRFVPEVFDVLTNAQMKTFDGNPAEHSPASNHTDHAIMGYEYKFEIHTTDNLLILSKTIKSGFRWHPKEVWAEINSNWTISMGQLSHQEMVDFFSRLKADGFTGVSFDVNNYVTSLSANQFFKLETYDSAISNFSERTPSNSEIRTLLEAINEAGLEVHARGMIYVSKKYQDVHGYTSQNSIDPSNPAMFFKNYGDLMIDLAKILNEYHVKLLTPFTEMEGIQKYPSLIKKMYNRISQTFDGQMGLEEATSNMLNYLSIPGNQKTSFEEVAGKYWNWTDAKGRPMVREYSCWAIPMDSQKDQRLSLMSDNFVKFWRQATDYYRPRYPDNPEMFGEQGVYQEDGVCLGGPGYWEVQGKGILDNQEVADVWVAYLQGDHELGINRINIWSFTLGDFWYGYDVADFMICLECPIYRVITSIIKPEE